MSFWRGLLELVLVIESTTPAVLVQAAVLVDDKLCKMYKDAALCERLE